MNGPKFSDAERALNDILQMTGSDVSARRMAAMLTWLTTWHERGAKDEREACKDAIAEEMDDLGLDMIKRRTFENIWDNVMTTRSRAGWTMTVCNPCNARRKLARDEMPGQIEQAAQLAEARRLLRDALMFVACDDDKSGATLGAEIAAFLEGKS